MNEALKIASHVACPVCNGSGEVQKPVYWSDGWGMAGHVCELCDGTKSMPTNLIPLLLQYKERALKAENELRSLQTHVHCFLSSEQLERDGVDTNKPGKHIPGMPGASTDPNVWRGYLRDAANVAKVRLVANSIRLAASDHAHPVGGHHTKAPEWSCATTNSRLYCPHCHPKENT